jgi:type I restriction enzyme M protein
MGGRCAVIVPDGVLFGSSNAHVALRKKLVEENRLDGVISMPGGVFKPYAGVSTAVLLFTKGAKTDRIWFYDMEGDGFSLDDKRLPGSENDIPDLLQCWEKRSDAEFMAAREARIKVLKAQLDPLKEERLKLEGEIHRLTFEQAISESGDGPVGEALQEAKRKLEELNDRLKPVMQEYEQLSRQFWVTKEQVKANKYDLTASRYRQVDVEEVYYEKPAVAIDRMRIIEAVILNELDQLNRLTL